MGNGKRAYENYIVT